MQWHETVPASNGMPAQGVRQHNTHTHTHAFIHTYRQIDTHYVLPRACLRREYASTINTKMHTCRHMRSHTHSPCTYTHRAYMYTGTQRKRGGAVAGGAFGAAVAVGAARETRPCLCAHLVRADALTRFDV